MFDFLAQLVYGFEKEQARIRFIFNKNKRVTYRKATSRLGQDLPSTKTQVSPVGKAPISKTQ